MYPYVYIYISVYVYMYKIKHIKTICPGGECCTCDDPITVDVPDLSSFSRSGHVTIWRVHLLL